MFTRYAAIVKNLRGVVVFNLDEDGVWDSLVWLVQRFRYRNLGLTPLILQRYRSILRDYLNGNPFRELVYPIEVLKGLTSILSKIYYIPDVLAEGIVFASTYISPMILVGNTYRAGIEENAIEIVRICKDKKMDVKQWKLHLRIADYTVLDFYEKNIDENLRVLKSIIEGNINISEVKNTVEKRIERVKKDTKRYWRIKCESGTPFLYYMDPLRKMVDSVINGSISPRELELEYAVGLSIVPVVYIPPKQKA